MMRRELIMRKQWITGIALMLLCAMLLSACGGPIAPAGGTTAAQTTAPASAGTGSASGSGQSGTQTEAAPPDDQDAGLDPVTLHFYFYDGKKEQTDNVWAAIGDAFKEELNVTFDVQFIAGTDYKDKMLVKFAAGDKWDLNYDADWVSFLHMIGRDAYMELDDIMPLYAPDLWARYQELGTLSSAMNKGKVVGMPWTLIKTTRPTFAYRGDLADTAGISIDPATVNTIEAVDEVLFAMREAYPDRKILRIALDEVWHAKYEINPVSNQGNFVFDLNDPECKVMPFEQHEAYREMAKYAKKWQDADIIWKDVLIDQTNFNTMVNQGLLITNWGTHESKYTKKNFAEEGAFLNAEIMYPENLSINRTPIANVTAIPVTSENPERTLMFLNLLETSQELYDMVHYGIPDVTYVLNDAGEVSYPGDMTSSNSNYMDFGGRWALWKPQFMRPDAVYPPGYWVESANFCLEVEANIFSPIEGFVFDVEPVSTEVSQRNQIFDDANKLVTAGLAGDADQAIDKMIEDLRNAHLDVIQAELQRQLDEYMANKGN